MRDFTDTDARIVSDYGDAVCHRYRDIFNGTAAFARASGLLARFYDATRSVESGGWDNWSSVETAHNELCIAAALLQAPHFMTQELVYEPPPDTGSRTVDFRARGSDGRVWIIDVKTVAPGLINRWEQFETARSQNWLSDRNELVLRRDRMGGEIWHAKTAARGRMLEYTLELESKLAGYPGWDPATTILMLCGNGFDWHEDDLEDFVAFYVGGQHRADDSLGTMERHHIDTKRLELPRLVKRFGFCQRSSLEIEPSKINWAVRPPKLPLNNQ
jgi:hypothetical protein